MIELIENYYSVFVLLFPVVGDSVCVLILFVSLLCRFYLLAFCVDSVCCSVVLILFVVLLL